MTDDGGPAFPRAGQFNHLTTEGKFTVSSASEQCGMSLRDWFAGQALWMIVGILEDRDSDHKPKDVAKCAYEIADAMLEARKR